MIQVRRSEERGHADHGWLDTYYTFSFAGYRDPDFMGFRTLRVLNQDRVAPSAGFPQHGHRDMEIVTWVLEGVLEHADSMGNGSRIRPGQAQLMSAASGVTHSEFNPSPDEPLHLLQMWVLPRVAGGAPRYAEKTYDTGERTGRLCCVVAPAAEAEREGALAIGQDARLFVASLAPGDEARHALAPGRAAWVHVATGRVTLDGEELGPGDGAAVIDQPELTLAGREAAEVVLWDLA